MGKALALLTITSGNSPVSRWIIGGNPFWNYSHPSAALGRDTESYAAVTQIKSMLSGRESGEITASRPHRATGHLWHLAAAPSSRSTIQTVSGAAASSDP